MATNTLHNHFNRAANQAAFERAAVLNNQYNGRLHTPERLPRETKEQYRNRQRDSKHAVKLITAKTGLPTW